MIYALAGACMASGALVLGLKGRGKGPLSLNLYLGAVLGLCAFLALGAGAVAIAGLT